MFGASFRVVAVLVYLIIVFVVSCFVGPHFLFVFLSDRSFCLWDCTVSTRPHIDDYSYLFYKCTVVVLFV